MTTLDYTSVANVIQALRSKKPANVNPDTTYLGTLVTAASRDIDHYCTGVSDGSSDGYFALTAQTDELLRGRVDNHGILKFWPHKPSIAAITALATRAVPGDSWAPIGDLSQTVITGPMVECYNASAIPSGRIPLWNGWGRNLSTVVPADIFVKVSYSGGLGVDLAALPGDLVLIATDLTIRYYREERAGIADAIGVESLGVMTYTKRMPERIARQLQPYKRTVGWNLPV
jgi:hypothetical protein